MTPPPLIDAAGRPLTLGAKLGGGGEGDVYALSDNAASVVKLYHRPPGTDAVEKLAAMAGLGTPPLLKVAAWPTGLVRDARTRQVAGFVMPRVADCQPVQTLYNPAQRLRSFPRAGWAFQVRAALNLAAAFEEVHKAGCLVGDVNQSNALVSAKAEVRLIDCDSFQVRAGGRVYGCDVGVPHYTPPELQGQPLRGVARTENHDRFGLAVLVYQLLFVGRHPYAGIYGGADDPSFDQLIADYRFAQGPDAGTWQMAPPPHVPTLSDVPPALGTLFRRAFERRTAGHRPTATEWHAELQHLDARLTTCGADSGHTHWRGAGACVWCRLGKGGPEYYFGVAGGVGTFAVDEAALREVLRRLEAVEPEDFPCERGQFAPLHPATGTPLPLGVANHLATRRVVGSVGGVCGLSAASLMCVDPTAGFIAFLMAIVCGVWYWLLVSSTSWQRENEARRVALDYTMGELLNLEARWNDIASGYGQNYSRLQDAVDESLGRCRGLASGCQRELAQLQANAEAAGRQRHLRLYPLADASIPNVGAGRKQALAGFGILTAADVTRAALLAVPGFGPALVANVIAWRDGVLATYRFDPACGVSPAEQAAVIVKFRGKQQQLLAEVGSHLTALETLAPAARDSLRTLNEPLRQWVAAYEQARADLRVLTCGS